MKRDNIININYRGFYKDLLLLHKTLFYLFINPDLLSSLDFNEKDIHDINKNINIKDIKYIFKI